MSFVAHADPLDATRKVTVRSASPPLISRRWTRRRANAWYAAQRWLVGANYVPAYAINQIEMWQAECFDPRAIARELDWAAAIGMNTMRVFLHDLLWQEDAAGFRARIDRFLDLSATRGIRPMLVLFDSVWHPEPQLGRQGDPVRGIHNSGWVQSPHRDTLEDRDRWPWLQEYVTAVVEAFARDERVLLWDVWNEPDNIAMGTLAKLQSPRKAELVAELLPHVFDWVRDARPVQPLTSGVWHGGDWGPASTELNPIQRSQLDMSDVISFHNYEWPEGFEGRIAELRPYGRPIMCTEWLARTAGSTVDTVLPIGKRRRVGMYNWGFVAGRSQTTFPWDSWDRPYDVEHPPVWFHDLLRPDGTPFRARETELIRELTSQPAARDASPTRRL